MTGLKKETIIGLTFGQIIAVLTLFALIMGVWINSQLAIARLEVKTEQNTLDITSIKTDMENKRLENKTDHEKILKKIEEGNKEIIDKIETIK